MDKIWISQPQSYSKMENESRRFILYPKLLKLIESCKPKTILDFGCGDGTFIKKVDSRVEISLYDISSKALKLAKKNFKGRKVNYYSASYKIPSNHFDCVILSLVLMTIRKRHAINKIMKEMYRVKKPTGKLIIAITHPCFRQFEYSTFFTEYSEGKEFNYFEDGEKFQVCLKDLITNEKIKFYDYHWSLSTTLNLILRNRLTIKEIIELPDFKVDTHYYNPYFPTYLIIVCE